MTSKQSSTLNVNVELLQSNIIRVSITTLSPRFKVPFETLRTDFGQHSSQHNNDATIDDFVQVSDDQTPFKLSIHEYKRPDSTYFRIDENSLIMHSLYVSLETSISTTGKLYGLGERVGDFFIKEGTYTTWSHDAMDPFDDGKPPGKNIFLIEY